MPETMLRGEGYVSQSVRSFYRHYHKVANTLYDVSGRDMVKMQQLLTYTPTRSMVLSRSIATSRP
eukprot:3666867-Pleurochrysis_carterae.AAC.1